MPVKFKIYPEQGFVFVSFYGIVSFSDSVNSAKQYAGDPTYRPEQNLALDLSEYEGTSEDFVAMMHSIAQVSGILTVGQSERLLVYIAPNPKSRAVAQFFAKSMAAIPGYVVRIVDNHLHAFEILGVEADGQPKTCSNAST